MFSDSTTYVAYIVLLNIKQVVTSPLKNHSLVSKGGFKSKI